MKALPVAGRLLQLSAGFFAALLVGCGTIRDHRIVQQPLNTSLTASVGATLFHLEKKGDLPNVYGGRDIYGGKVAKGYAAVRLKAIRDSRFIDLIAYDVNQASSETTFDRYRPLARVDVSQTVNIGGSSDGIEVTIDSQQEREYTLSGIRISFLNVRPSSVTYQLEDLQPKPK